MNNIESTVLQVVEKLEELASQNDSLWFNQQVLDQVNVLRQALEQPPKEDKQPCNPSCAPGYCYCTEMTEQAKAREGGESYSEEQIDNSERIIGSANVCSHEQASEFIEKMLWEVIDVSAMFPRAKPDPRTWEHLMVYAPKREWVGLTREEKAHILDHCTTVASAVKAIESKLKEKNV